MEPTYRVAVKHPGLSDEDLDRYLADSIRSEQMLALTPMLILPGPLYRGRSTLSLEPRLLTSWAATSEIANQFGKYVSSTPRLEAIAVVVHTDFTGTWVEYVGWPTL